VAAYHYRSSNKPEPVADTFSASKGCPLRFGLYTDVCQTKPKQQGRSQTFTTDEASVARANGESFLGPGSGGMPRENFLKLLSLNRIFSIFSWDFSSKFKLVQV